MRSRIFAGSYSLQGEKKEQKICSGKIRQYLDRWWKWISPTRDIMCLRSWDGHKTLTKYSGHEVLPKFDHEENIRQTPSEEHSLFKNRGIILLKSVDCRKRQRLLKCSRVKEVTEIWWRNSVWEPNWVLYWGRGVAIKDIIWSIDRIGIQWIRSKCGNHIKSTEVGHCTVIM